MQQVLLVGIGGFFGSIARFLVSRYASEWYNTIPIGTLIVNVTGSFIIGVIYYGIANNLRFMTPELRALGAVGFVGAYTTMSTFAYETFRFIELKDFTLAIINFSANIILCFLAVYLGRAVVLLIGGH